MGSSAGTILAFVAVALLAGALLVLGGDRYEVQAALGPTDAPPPGSAVEHGLELSARSALPATAPAPAPAALFLERFYGDEAPEVRAVLAERGIDPTDLDLPLPEQDLLALVPTWLVYEPTERAEQRRQKLSWPEELTSEWLSARYGVLVDLPQEQLDVVAFEADLARPGIEAAVDRYLDELEAAMLVEYAAGRVAHSPFLEWPLPTPDAPQDGADFYSMVRIGAGWVVRVGLEERSHPAAVAARADLKALVHSRDDQVREALLALQ